MRLLFFLALLCTTVLGLAGTWYSPDDPEFLRSARISDSSHLAALTIVSPDNPAVTTYLVKKDGGFNFIGSEDNDTTITSSTGSITSSALPMSTVTAVHKNMTTAFWTLWESGWASAMVISTQSSTDTTSVFTTSTFNDTIPTMTGPASYAAPPTPMTSNGKQVIFTVTTILEGTFDVHGGEFAGMHWATTRSEVNTQTDWPWPPTKSMTVPVVESMTSTATTTTPLPVAVETTYTTTTVDPTPQVTVTATSWSATTVVTVVTMPAPTTSA